MKTAIGQRIKAERERKKISQQKLATALGWNHHQIVSDVEQGKREIKAWELYEIAKFLHVDIDLLIGSKEPQQQPYVLWRQKPSHNEKILEARFINECNNYLWIEEAISNPTASSTLIVEKLSIKQIDLANFTLEHAYQLAESIRQCMALGEFPTAQLLGVLEDRYDIKFIVLNDEMEFSAACSRSERGCFILINGRHPEVRQYFSIAHELFHLITWEPEMLKLVDSSQKYHEKNEQLANAFAAGLLIPREKLEIEAAKICTNKSMAPSDVIALTEQFQVSKEAMLYRMLNVGLISHKQLTEINDALQTVSTVKISNKTIAHFLRSKYVRLVYLGLERVKISRAKAAKLLDVDLCDLSDLFNEYGFTEVNAV